MKQPAIMFYTGDWLKDPALSMCSAATRGIWMDALCAMHESDRSGFIEGTPDQLSRCLRSTPSEVLAAVRELASTGAADLMERNGVVTLVNRRMHRDYKERVKANLRQKRARGKPIVTPLSRVCHDNVTPHSSITSSIPPPPKASSATRDAILRCGVLANALDGGGGAALMKNAGTAYQVFRAFDEIQSDKKVANAPGVLLARLKAGPLPREPLSAEVVVRIAKRCPIRSVAGTQVNGSTIKFTSGNRLVVSGKTVDLNGLDPSEIEFEEA